MHTASSYAAIFPLPHGAVGVRCVPSLLAGLDYLPAQPELAPAGALAGEVVRQLRAWLDEPEFRFDLPLAPAGSAFRQRVWQAIAAIPCGQTLTYGELARRLDSAPRAVGQACGANPYPIVVPCHRVVATRGGLNGGLGGFAHATQGYLLDIKRWLLEREAASRSLERRQHAGPARWA
jgi:methylated-DNA-[protein]-cysteine S-methyltransferase